MKKLREIISYFIYVCNWEWLEHLIAFVCELECKLKTKELNIKNKEDLVPKGIYCYWNNYVCPYLTNSIIAKLLYGEQCAGYCTLMKKGDFSIEDSTDLLWDFCKCCGIKIDDEDILECNLEL